MQDESKKISYAPFKNTSLAIGKIANWWFKMNPDHGMGDKYLQKLKFPAYENALYDLDMKLTSIVFIHGLTAHGSLHYGYSAELASHGYLVMNLDVISGDASYTELEDGKQIWFEKNLPYPGHYSENKYKSYRPFYKKRVDQVKVFIDELKKIGFAQKILGFPLGT